MPWGSSGKTGTPGLSPSATTRQTLAFVDKNSPWQRITDRTPLEIWLIPKSGTPSKVAEGFNDISAITVSSDLWRLYVADKRQRYLLSMSIAPDGSLKDLRRINVLVIATGSTFIGARDMALDTHDRLYAATDAGIQVAIPDTYVQLILPLPGDLPADKVVFADQTLYATSGNRVFKRLLKVAGRTEQSSISPTALLATTVVEACDP